MIFIKWKISTHYENMQTLRVFYQMAIPNGPVSYGTVSIFHIAICLATVANPKYTGDCYRVLSQLVKTQNVLFPQGPNCLLR